MDRAYPRDRAVHGHGIVLLRRELPGAGRWRWRLGLREALEHLFQPCQQAGLVGIAQGQLHLTAADGQAHIHGCRSLWQGRGGRGVRPRPC